MPFTYDNAPKYETAPLGIKLFCVLAALAGLYALSVSITATAVGGSEGTVGFALVVLSLCYLALIYGLWTLEPWAWWFAMVLFVIDLGVDIVTVDIVGVLISIVLIGYLGSKRPYYREASAGRQRP